MTLVIPANAFRRIGIAALLTSLVACGGGGGGGAAPVSPVLRCTDELRKDWVLSTTEDWYLFQDTLPAEVNPAEFETADALLDFLTESAREQGLDRGFSYLTTQEEDQSFFGEGQFVGFGLRTRIRAASELDVLEVFESSPAADAGLARGATITAIDAGEGFRSIAEWLVDDPELATALGPAEEGVTRAFRFTLAGELREVSITKRLVTIDPIAESGGTATLPLAGTAGVGYLNLRTFVSTANSELRDAFADFRTAGLTDFIVDLRYNGGGLVATAELLGDLLGAARSNSDVFSRTRFNDARAAANDSTRFFRDEAAAVAPVRIAFLTTDYTASASELVINSMAPWAEVAIVGDNTFGKPVGQSAFDLAACGDRLRLVTFRTDNALDQGGYFEGLAPYLTFACSAPDDLARPMGDPAESMTSAALDWLGTGQCGSVIGSAASRKTLLDAAPRSVEKATPHRRDELPGVF
ncbi:MAG TPA: S41 family peptidase [Steroidobacteraceae bacterium]|nr:S41 family peptidase [Steroidobacteraceae bacterium]